MLEVSLRLRLISSAHFSVIADQKMHASPDPHFTQLSSSTSAEDGIRFHHAPQQHGIQLPMQHFSLPARHTDDRTDQLELQDVPQKLLPLEPELTGFPCSYEDPVISLPALHGHSQRYFPGSILSETVAATRQPWSEMTRSTEMPSMQSEHEVPTWISALPHAHVQQATPRPAAPALSQPDHQPPMRPLHSKSNLQLTDSTPKVRQCTGPPWATNGGIGLSLRDRNRLTGHVPTFNDVPHAKVAAVDVGAEQADSRPGAAPSVPSPTTLHIPLPLHLLQHRYAGSHLRLPNTATEIVCAQQQRLEAGRKDPHLLLHALANAVQQLSMFVGKLPQPHGSQSQGSVGVYQADTGSFSAALTEAHKQLIGLSEFFNVDLAATTCAPVSLRLQHMEDEKRRFNVNKYISVTAQNQTRQAFSGVPYSQAPQPPRNKARLASCGVCNNGAAVSSRPDSTTIYHNISCQSQALAEQP